ncbi:MAG: mechanosensitive ion channel [Amaricoccus sp.]|uniref:mechanosensitive ion channel family protein n=1 Tax=Amaricoccus sp. TaxID=1872485 RepID=UPI0039E612D5
MRSLLCLLFLLLGLGTAVADTPGFVSPLQPLDTSSPRATLLSLRELGDQLDTAYAAYLEHPSLRLQRQVNDVLGRIDRLFDLSETAPVARQEIGVASFGMLKDILMRLPEIDPTLLPDDPNVTSARLPGTEIEIVRMESGPDRGKFLFSAETVERLPEFSARVMDLPVLHPAPYDSWRAEQVRFTGPLVPRQLHDLPEPFQTLVFGTPAWKVAATLVLFVAALALATLWATACLRAAERLAPTSAHALRLSIPIVLAALILGARSYALGQLNLSGRFHEITNAMSIAVAVIAAAWLARSLLTLLAELVVMTPAFAEDRLDSHLARLVGRVLGLLSAAAILVYGANALGVPVLGLVAGVGVSGLALALAAQSTIENLFGGVSIFADRPFRVGDFIIYDGGEGHVESIGPRSTRIRAADGMQITVPNAELAKMQVTNKTCRDATLFRHVISLDYGATEAQIAAFAARMLAEIARYPLDVDPEVPPRVRVVALRSYAIDVEIQADLLARSEDDFYRMQEELLLAAMALVNSSGLAFAHPVQTILTDAPAAIREAGISVGNPEITKG